eukprot:UN14781
MLWIYLGLHIQGNYNIDYEEYLKVGEWVSFRERHGYLTMEVNVLAIVIFFASIKALRVLNGGQPASPFVFPYASAFDKSSVIIYVTVIVHRFHVFIQWLACILFRGLGLSIVTENFT